MRAIRQPWIGHGIILAVLVASIGAARAVYLEPRQREMKALKAEEAGLMLQLADFQRGVQDMEAWSRAHPGVDFASFRERRALQARVMVPEFLTAIAPVAERHRVATRQIQPIGAPVDEIVSNPGGGQDVYRRVELRFQLVARYRDLGEYLREVESMSQLAVVRSVALRFDSASYPDLAADVTLWLYGTP